MQLTSGKQVLEKVSQIFSRRPISSSVLLFVAVAFVVWQQWSDTDTGGHFNGKWKGRRDATNIHLTKNQCDRAFPGLFVEIDRAVESRRELHISAGELDSIEPKNGYVRAMIFDQQLYVVAKRGNIYSREKAVLQAIHRAILSSPERIPNIEFVFNTDDIIFEHAALWGFARREQDIHIWLIPDFGYWSWPETKVGTMREVQSKAKEIEVDGHVGFSSKIPRLLWRGATMGLPLREKLIEVTRDKPWADVIALDWHDNSSMTNDLKSMPEHCLFKYLAHTEGNSYSGRLKYLQSCESVIVAHKLDWLQHHHPLMISAGPHQNYVEIDRNFEQLEAEIRRLESQPKEAARIARNSVNTFRERYLTPAAEACYWRHLFHGWAEVSFEPQFYSLVDGKKFWRGMPVESFILEGRMAWDPY